VSTDAANISSALFDGCNQFVVHAEHHVGTPPSMKTWSGMSTFARKQSGQEIGFGVTKPPRFGKEQSQGLQIDGRVAVSTSQLI
jgi:hypothetical protein